MGNNSNSNLSLLSKTSVFSNFIQRVIRFFASLFGLSKHNKTEGVTQVQDIDSNIHIRKYLDSYLNCHKPGFSVFIKGPWGSGKTFFIRHYKCPWKSFKFSCYVSLFGIDSKKEFEFRLWKGIIFSYGILTVLLPTLLIGFFIYKLFNWSLFHNMISFCARWLQWGIVGIIGIFLWNVIKYKLMDILLFRRYIILDDFERTEASCELVFSWISELVEHESCPVILLGNENEIQEKLNFDNIQKVINKYKGSDVSIPDSAKEQAEDNSILCHYKKVKEKVIGKEFYLKENDFIICYALCEQLNLQSVFRQILFEDIENIKWFIKTVLDPLHQKGIGTNYRALQYVMREFDLYFSELNTLVANQKVWKILVPQFFSFMYFKKVHELNASLVFSDEFAKDLFPTFNYTKNEVVNSFREMFPCWFRKWNEKKNILPEYIWSDINAGKYVSTEALRQSINHFLCPSLSLTEKWQTFFNMEDKEFGRLVRDTLRAYRKHSIHSPEEIISIARNVFICLNSLPQLQKFSKRVTEMFNAYISVEKSTLLFARNLKLFKQFYDQKSHIESYFDDMIRSDKNYIEIKNMLLEAVQEVFSHCTTELYKELIEAIQQKAEEFDIWYYADDRIRRDMFSGQNPEELWSVMALLSTEDFNNLLENFKLHIGKVVDANSIAKSEIDFWKTFIHIVNQTKDEWEKQRINLWKRHRINDFCKNITHQLGNP